MNKLLSTALAIAVVTGAGTSHADEILTEENMDLITAGLALNSYSITATGLLLLVTLPLWADVVRISTQ